MPKRGSETSPSALRAGAIKDENDSCVLTLGLVRQASKAAILMRFNRHFPLTVTDMAEWNAPSAAAQVGQTTKFKSNVLPVLREYFRGYPATPFRHNRQVEI
jgi:hypothetical protein